MLEQCVVPAHFRIHKTHHDHNEVFVSNSPIKDLRLLMLIVPENKREICENKQYNSMDVQYSILTRWQYQIESTDC